jgi:hypothetical protein
MDPDGRFSKWINEHSHEGLHHICFAVENIDVDLTLYDPAGKSAIDSSQWLSNSKVTDRLYHGRRQIGKVAGTIVNGTVVYNGSEIIADKEVGRFVRPRRNRMHNRPVLFTSEQADIFSRSRDM